MGDVTKGDVEIERLGPPGIEGVMLTVPIIAGDRRSREERLGDETARQFSVKAQLGRFTPFQTSNIEAQIQDRQGESYLSIPDEWRELKVDTRHGAFWLYANDRQELATVSHECSATSWRDAFERCQAGIAPILDSLAYRADVPVQIVKLYCYDRRNQVHATSYTTPYRQMLVRGHPGKVWLELIPIYALYREAKASSSPFYRFLCYFKIIEGVFNSVRPNLMARARSQGIAIQTRRECVPPHPELGAELAAHVGRAVKAFVDDVLTEDYRHAVAHFALGSGSLLNPSDYKWSARFADVILVSELCARVVVETQESYCEQFYSQGGQG